MDELGQALPLALGASVYPPGLVVLALLLSGSRPRRLVSAFFAGAALLTVAAGLVALTAVQGAGLTDSHSATASGWVYVGAGVVLLALAAWAWRRRGRDAAGTRGGAGASRGRIAVWSGRATTSARWAFGLGLAMFLPSPLYLLAVKQIADGGDSSASKVLAVLVCAAAVLLFVEVPLAAMFVRPAEVAAGIERFRAWIGRNGWTLVAVLAVAGGIDAFAKGISALG